MITPHEFNTPHVEVFSGLPVEYGETLRNPDADDVLSGNTSTSASLGKVYDWLQTPPDISRETWESNERLKATHRLELLYRAMTSQSLINIALTLPEHGTTIADVDQHPDAYHHSLLASERQKADVITTSEVARALLFNPADCPIVNIAYYRDGLVQSIAQIHAGAKGIMSDVAGKALAQFKKRGLSPTDAVAYLAPHGQTYTLYGPPLEQAEQGGLGAYLHPTKQPGHKRFDMMAATIDQLTDAGVPFDQIQASYVDTLEDPRYYSQRIQSSRATESQQNNPDIPPFGRNAVMFVKK